MTQLRRYTQRSVWRKHKWELRAALVIVVCAGLYYFLWPAGEPGDVVTDGGESTVAQADTLRRSLSGKVRSGDYELSRIVGTRSIDLADYVELDFHIIPDSLIFRIPNLHKVNVTFTRISDGSEVMQNREDDVDEDYKDVTWEGGLTEEDTLRVTLHPIGHTELTHALSEYNLDWVTMIVRSED